MPNNYNEDQKKLTTSSIRTSLIKIMEQKDFKSINVSEVCKKAGVSRMAFYRHFKDLEEVIEIFLEETFEAYLEEIQHVDLSNTYTTSLLFFQFIEKEQNFFNTLIKSGHMDTVSQYFDNSIQYLFRTVDLGYNLEEHQLRYYGSYRAGGLNRLLVAWLNGGMVDSPETMAELATRFDLK